MQTVSKIPSQPERKYVLIGKRDHYGVWISCDFRVSHRHGGHDFFCNALVPLRETGGRAKLDFGKDIYLYAELLRVVSSQRSHQDGLTSHRNKVQFSMAM